MHQAWRSERHVFSCGHFHCFSIEFCMKNLRHTAIRELLVKTTVSSNGSSNGAITNQNDLRRKLAARGFHVTQATLSRDIRDLKLMKGPTGYALPSNFDDDADDLPEIAGVLQDFGLEVRQAQNLLVVLIICPDTPNADTLRSRLEAYIA
jgi:arginine repressor